MIGLVDFDLQTTKSSSLAPPNIEIMKLATYYRLEENRFCRLVSLTDEQDDLTAYDTVYFFSESETPVQVPRRFLLATNVEYGGTAFTNGIYQPFQNNIIDFTIPRPTIYKEYLTQKYHDGIKSKVISHVIDDTYYRKFAGEERLPLPPILPRKRLFVYDTEFFTPKWEQFVRAAEERKCSSIQCIHPIVCNSLTDYFNVRSYPKVARTNRIVLDINVPVNEIDYMFKKYKNLFLADIAQSSNITLQIGGTLKSGLQYYADFIYKLNLMYAFWARGIPMRLSYKYPTMGKNNPIQYLSIFVAQWTKNLNNKPLEIRLGKRMSEERLEWEHILKFHPNAKDLFNQSFTDLSKRGYWRL